MYAASPWLRIARLWAIAWGCLVLAGCPFGRPVGPPGEVEVKTGATRPQPSVYRHRSGLTVIHERVGTAPVVALQVWVRVGSGDELPAEAGLAHVHEHMLFKGTERRPVGRIAWDVEAMGGMINAFTSFDQTVYHLIVPSRFATEGLDVLIDAVRNSVFDESELTRELQVIHEELLRGRDIPSRVLSESLFATAFTTHPYGRPIIGTEQSIASFERDDVVAFFERWYRPDNMTLVVVGDIDRAALDEALDELTAGWTGSSTARPARPVEPTQTALRTTILHRDTREGYLGLAFHAPALSSDDAPALDLLSMLLGYGDSSLLFERVQRGRGLVNGIGAYYYATAEPGLFVVSSSFLPDEANGGPAEVVAAIAREVALLRTDPPSRRELERVRTVFENQAIYQTRTVEGIANRLGYFHTVAGDLDFERTFVERVRRVTPEQIAEVAERWLRPENLTIGLMLPESWRDRSPDQAALGAIVAQTWEDTAAAATSGIVADQYGIVRHVFDNGLVLLIEADPTSPTFTARAAALSGALFEPEDAAGITHFAAELLTSGTTRHSASELSREVDGLAAGLSGFSGRNSMGAQVTALSGDVDDALELLAEVLFDATFPVDEVERVRRETLEAIAASEDDLAGTAYRMFASEIFGTHPYSRPMIGTDQSIRSMTRSEVQAWSHATLRPERMVVAVVGDVDAAEVINTVGAVFSRAVDGPALSALPPTALPDRHEARSEQTRDRQQAHIVLGYPAVAEDDPARASLDVLAAILSGQGGRLFVELRDRQGLAYSVSASNSAAVGAGTFSFYIATSDSNLEAAIAAMHEQIERLRTEGVTPDEVARAQRLLLGRRDISLQRQNARAGHLCIDTLLGRGHEFRWLWPEQLEAVTVESVSSAIARVFAPGGEVLTVVRPGAGMVPAE